jgi:hypothetical protein
VEWRRPRRGRRRDGGTADRHRFGVAQAAARRGRAAPSRAGSSRATPTGWRCPTPGTTPTAGASARRRSCRWVRPAHAVAGRSRGGGPRRAHPGYRSAARINRVCRTTASKR